MDLLAEHGDAIEEEVFWNSADLFKLDVDLVFCDATPALFETDDKDVASQEWRGLKFEPLRKRGHSKEGRYILATPIRKIKKIKDDVLSHPGRYADIALGYRGCGSLRAALER